MKTLILAIIFAASLALAETWEMGCNAACFERSDLTGIKYNHEEPTNNKWMETDLIFEPEPCKEMDAYNKGMEDALLCVALVNLEFNVLRKELKTFEQMNEICRVRLTHRRSNQ